MSRSYRDDYDDDDDDPPIRRRSSAGPKPHSMPGVLSFVGAILAGLGVFVLIIIAAIIDAARNGNVRDDDPAIIAVGFGVIVCALIGFAGFILGLVGVFQTDRNTLFAMLGAALNGLLLLGVVALLCIGIAMG